MEFWGSASQQREKGVSSADVTSEPLQQKYLCSWKSLGMEGKPSRKTAGDGGFRKVEEKEEETAVGLGTPGTTGLAQRDMERGWKGSLE